MYDERPGGARRGHHGRRGAGAFAHSHRRLSSPLTQHAHHVLQSLLSRSTRHHHELAFHRTQTPPTAALANPPQSHSHLGVDQILPAATFLVGLNVGALVLLVAAASKICFSAQRRHPPRTNKGGGSEPPRPPVNRSTEQGGSKTALLALWGRSQAYRMGLPGASDNLAPELMRQLSLFGNPIDGNSDDGGGANAEYQLGKALTSLCADLSVLNHRITGGVIFEDQIARLATLGNAGLVGPMHLRTAWMDGVVEWFVETHFKDDNSDDGSGNEVVGDSTLASTNVVIFGSGYDTRPYRIDSLRNEDVRVYEVDAPGTQAQKRRVLQQAGILPKEGGAAMPSFVSCDFDNEDWLECLRREGFDGSLPTLVLWEGVTMYLPLSVIQSTLDIVASRGKLDGNSSNGNAPWYVAFDYLNPKWASSRVWKLATQFAKEPFRSAFTETEVEQLLETSGLDAIEHWRGRADARSGFLGLAGDGKDGPMLGNYGGFVLAASK